MTGPEENAWNELINGDLANIFKDIEEALSFGFVTNDQVILDMMIDVDFEEIRNSYNDKPIAQTSDVTPSPADPGAPLTETERAADDYHASVVRPGLYPQYDMDPSSGGNVDAQATLREMDKMDRE